MPKTGQGQRTITSLFAAATDTSAEPAEEEVELPNGVHTQESLVKEELQPLLPKLSSVDDFRESDSLVLGVPVVKKELSGVCVYRWA